MTDSPGHLNNQLLTQLLASVGALREDMGGVKARLDSGQHQFETIRKEQESFKQALTTVFMPLAGKVEEMVPHVDKAKETTRQFDAMKPEFKKMRVVTARFMTVALTGGAIVGAALWALGAIGPFLWEIVKSHVKWS